MMANWIDWNSVGSTDLEAIAAAIGSPDKSQGWMSRWVYTMIEQLNQDNGWELDATAAFNDLSETYSLIEQSDPVTLNRIYGMNEHDRGLILDHFASARVNYAVLYGGE